MKRMKVLLLGVVMLFAMIEVSAQFTDINVNLQGTYYSSVAWGDYDNDGDLDILISGQYFVESEWEYHFITKIYSNNGDGSFIDINAGLEGASKGTIAWGDYDNDGDLDILITGYTSYSYTCLSRVYRNNGNGSFQIIANFTGVYDCSAAWGDYDNDGDLDILIAGRSATNTYCTTVYRNNGDSTFTDIDAGLTGVYYSSVSWSDYDNDGDLDILLCGQSATDTYITKIYRNDGNGSFIDINAGIPGFYQGFTAWGDYDNDGDLDICISGRYSSYGNCLTKIYRNDGAGSFTERNSGLIGVYTSSVTWGDYDNDGDLDLLLCGQSNGNTYTTKLYRNNGNGSFTDIPTVLTGVNKSSLAWGDYDNDGDLDILLSGQSADYTYISKLSRNDIAINNTIPSVPTNLRTTNVGDYASFQWDVAIDAQTPSSGLNYSLKIGSSPGSSDIMSPMASMSGYKLSPIKGNVNSSCSWNILRTALPETCYWSVQTVDSGFSGSAFSGELEYNSLPEISLITPQSVEFGEIPITGLSPWAEIRIKNPVSALLTISNVSFYQLPSQFNYDYPNQGSQVVPGDVDTLLIRFSPTSTGTVTDTLYIESNSLNSPILKISLSGTGIYVPPMPPENINIAMVGYNAFISWDAVTQTIYNTPFIPDGYLVFYNGTLDPDNGIYYYLAVTENLTYTHVRVGEFADYMFYHVVAYKYFGRGAFDITSMGLLQGMPEAEVWQRLRE